jgi:hypothetical protein
MVSTSNVLEDWRRHSLLPVSYNLTLPSSNVGVNSQAIEDSAIIDDANLLLLHC